MLLIGGSPPLLARGFRRHSLRVARQCGRIGALLRPSCPPISGTICATQTCPGAPSRMLRNQPPGRGGDQETTGGTEVIGRACRIQTVPPARAHSTSCGPVEQALDPADQGGHRTGLLRAHEAAVGAAALRPGSGHLPVLASSRPGDEWLTAAPHSADQHLLPVAGYRVGAEGDSGQLWHDQPLHDDRAIARSRPAWRYPRTRSLSAEAAHLSIAARNAVSPLTSRMVSYRPAKEASGRSSAKAEERTASDTSR